MVWLNLKFNFKIVIISIQKSFLLLILIPFLSGLFHFYSNSISNSFAFLLSIAVKKSFPFPFPLMEISLLLTMQTHHIRDILLYRRIYKAPLTELSNQKHSQPQGNREG